MDWRLELVAVPVSDVDRAKAFYVDRVGFVADHDHRVPVDGGIRRFVQLTPPGSPTSIHLAGDWLEGATPGAVQGLQLVVADIEAAHAHLSERGAEVSPIVREPWGAFVFFRDPDGNGWSVQEIPDRG
jgi:catechol 2,3-dioxygenase-like lactoylglutathione lyase family enzyme